MKAKVIAVNPQGGFAAAQTPGGITVFELLGGDVEKGDIVSGDLESLGGEIFSNETQGMELDVYVQGVYCTPQSARKLMY